MRLTKIMTKKGDTGKSELARGRKLPKSSPEFEAMGDIDELNSWVGFIRSTTDLPEIDVELEKIQQDLFHIGGEISLEGEQALLSSERIIEIESQVSEWNRDLPPLREFVLPGGSELVSRIHVARSICRRTERHVSELHFEKEQHWIPYLNRLSDWFFVLARMINARDKNPEIQWEKDSNQH